MTVVGKQSGREIRPYQTDSGDSILMLHPNFRKAEEVFSHEHNQNRVETWLFRLSGWFVSLIGFNCLGAILEYLSKQTCKTKIIVHHMIIAFSSVQEHPLVARALALNYTSIPFTFSVSSTFIVTGISWLFYRPLLAFILVFLAALPSLYAVTKVYFQSQQDRRRRRY